MKFTFVLVLLLSTLFASATPTATAPSNAVTKDFLIYLLAGKKTNYPGETRP